MDLGHGHNVNSHVPVVDLDSNPNPSSNAVVSLLDDDDDDLQIVESFIRPAGPSSNHLLNNVDIQVVGSSNAQRNIDEVEAVSIVETPAPPTVCAACSADLSDDVFTVSRCKHALCGPCTIRCVAEIYPCQAPAQEPLCSDFHARSLKPDPMCVVKRCRAPLSSIDCDMALAPLSADRFFEQSFIEFKHWKADNVSDFIGPSHIVFPQFTADMAAEALCVDDGKGEGELVDDFAGAFNPLWLWDGDFEDGAGSAGAWICSACGLYHHCPSPVTDGGSSHATFNLSACTSEAVIPDHPPYPHCHKARAFGMMECIRRLTKVDEDNEPSSTYEEKTPARSSTRRGRGKRYKTARSIQASKRRRVTGFAKGTGYAGRVGTEWKGTSTKILEKTARVDAATAFWLARIRCFILRNKNSAYEAWPGYMRVLLRECKLTEHLAKILINESIMDVGERVPVYVAALRVVTALCDSPSLRRLVGEPNDGNGGRSVASLINSLSKQAALLTTGVGNENMCPKTKQLIRQIRKSIRGVNRYNLLQKTEHRKSAHSRGNLQSDHELVVKEGSSGSLSGVQAEIGGAADAEDGGNSPEKVQEMYESTMNKVQFETVAGLANASSFRNEIGNTSTSTVGRGQMLRRIASEVATLSASLPVSWSSTILLRVDEDRYDFLRACVFGPEDTPYECGAFLFDIFFPSNYPESPPKLKLLTTGGGRVRFNPNLYANGKVCLSLLGTWSGPSWTPASTLLQVLVSIQSLIMVAEPYFNEPGLERTMGTANGTRQSEQYNKRVRFHTANVAILDALRNPYNEFRNAIQSHFRLKRGAVERILLKWFNFRVQDITLKNEELNAPADQSAQEATELVPQWVNPENAPAVLPGMASFLSQPGMEAVPHGVATSLGNELNGLHSALSNQEVSGEAVPSGHAASSNFFSPPLNIQGMLFGHGVNAGGAQTEFGLVGGETPSALAAPPLSLSGVPANLGASQFNSSVETEKVSRNIIAELEKL